jgi:hypothetical protein
MPDEFKQYRKKQVSEMRPYEKGEYLSSSISINAIDRREGSPRVGDMIARDPTNHEDMWLVAEEYFNRNYEPV